MNSTVDVSVTVTSGPNLGVDWALTCGGSPNSIETTNVCGTLNPVHVGSNANMVYTAPAYVPVGTTVNLTATVTSDPTVSTTVALTINPLPITITWLTGSAPPAGLAAGGVQLLAVTVSNDPNAAGVKWSAACGGSSCGSFNPVSTASGSLTTFTAPISIPSQGSVTITATSNDSATTSIGATVPINPIAVAASINFQSVPAGSSATLTATVNWDASGAGVAWSAPSCAVADCGTITSSNCIASGVTPAYTTNCTAIYNAPASIPADDTTLPVTITASSAANPSQSATVSFNLEPPPPVSVTVSGSENAVQTGGQLTLTAVVADDFSNSGVTWQCNPGSCNPSSSSGASPYTTTFTAPSSVPTSNPVTLTATSIADPTKSGTVAATIVPSISVSATSAANPITAGGAASISAVVTNDIAPGGITWSASCSVAANCGTFGATTQTASGSTVTYSANFTASANALWANDPNVKITATSVASQSAPPVASGSVPVNVTPIPFVYFVPFAPSALPVANPLSPVMVNLIAASGNDSSHEGVDWSVCNSASTCGEFLISPAVPQTQFSSAVSTVYSNRIHAASGQQVSYLPPTTAPANGSVTITVASTANPSVSVSQNVTITQNLSPVSLQGTVMAGNLPVAGAQVQLYEAGNTGYGSTASPLQFTLNGTTVNSVATDQNGDFTIPAGYACTSQNSLLYLVALGGNPGGIGNNAQLGFMTALGPCANLNSSVQLIVNEETTVASVWSLARFMGVNSFADVSSSNANYNNGLAAAFATVNNLVDITVGQSLLFTPGGGEYTPAGLDASPVANGLVPQAEINTLADAIDTCAASVGGVPGDGSPCDMFFAASNTNPLGGVPNTSNEPTSIAQAVIELAQYPAKSGEYGAAFPFTGSALYDLIPVAGYPFSPILEAPPTDWTMALSFTGGGLEGVKLAAPGPSAMAIDGLGNVWISNRSISSVSELSNLGVSISPFATGSRANQAGGFTGGGMHSPVQIAVDQNGSVWVLNSNSGSGSTLTELDFTGTPVSCPASPYCGGSASGSPYSGAGNSSNSGNGLVIDGSGNIWVTEGGSPGDVAEYAGFNGLLLNGSKIENGGALSPAGTGYTNLTNANDPLDTSPAAPNGGIAMDDSGDLWLLDGANYTAVELGSSGALKEVDHGYSSINPSTGQPTNVLLNAVEFGNTMAVDRSGDVFIPQTPGGQQMYELYACKSTDDPNCLGLGTITINGYLPSLDPLLTVDGSQDFWMMSAACASCNAFGGPIPSALARFSSSGSQLNANVGEPSFGYIDPCSSSGCQPVTDYTPKTIAVDTSGNVWLLLFGAGEPTTVVEFVGVATPVITPASSALTAGKIAQAP
ncbi:MAG TPA: hypothetical protein VL986_07165 [Terracidiphilus sp.]|nr:hypothetical protein [Terracidiphilus sp.]